MRCFKLMVLIVGLSPSAFAADSPFSGTWKHKPVNGVPSDNLANVQADDQHIKLDQRFVDEKGQSHTMNFDAKFDGKDYPVSGDPSFDSVSVKRKSDHLIKISWKNKAKVLYAAEVSVSQDGKTTTVNYRDFRGKSPEKGTDVFDKQ